MAKRRERSASAAGKKITGRYLVYKTSDREVIVCKSCDSSLPHCASCNLPFHRNHLIHSKGESLCAKCYKNAKFCSLCGQRIKDRYIQDQKSGKLYCGSCYDSAPKCPVCKLPVKRTDIDAASGACWECMKKLPRCASCGKAIVGTYYTYRFAKGKYCGECNKNRPKCYCCGTPIGNLYWKFPDGRTICDRCNKRVINDVDQVRRIMKEVEGLIPRYLGIQVKEPYTVRVEALNNHSLIDASKVKNGEASGSPLFGSELGLYRRMNGKSEIFLLYGLPIEMIYETAAHEYAHAWQAEHCPPKQSKELLEGFAQWVAAEILRVKGYETALEKLQARRDDPYGTGYQRIHTGPPKPRPQTSPRICEKDGSITTTPRAAGICLA